MKRDASQPTKAEDYFDYEYAKRMWLNSTSGDVAYREFKKYETPFEAWVKKHTIRKQIGASGENKTKPVLNWKAALKALETHPDRHAIKKAHDLELLLEHWMDEIYRKWGQRFFRNGEAYRFDHLLIMRHDPAGKCWPKDRSFPSYDSPCGHIPDWRNPPMMKAIDALHKKNAAGHARWLKWKAREKADARAWRRILESPDPLATWDKYLKEQHGR